MKKKKLNLKSGRLALMLGCVAMLPVLYTVAAATLPYTAPFIEKAAVLSASLSFMVKGQATVMTGSMEGSTEVLTHQDETLEPIPYEEEPTLESEPPAPETAPPEENLPVAAKPENAGTVQRKTYTAGTTGIYLNLNQGFIKNCTSIPAQKILETVKKQPNLAIKTNAEPQVLIMHTHATEGYQASQLPWYDKAQATRTTDNSKNATRVGDEIEAQLTAAGIGVIHDKTLHDYPSYNGAYERSAVTVKRILKENPSIKVVLDVHRDAIQPDANTMIAPVTTIDGKDCAQVMIISGCDDGTMNMPNYMENLKLSAALQRQMEADYPTLARPILFDYRKYNQNLTTGSILLEMGGHANTLEEAIYCGELVGKSLAKALLALE